MSNAITKKINIIEMGLIVPSYKFPGQCDGNSNVYIAVAYHPIVYGWSSPLISQDQPFIVNYEYGVWWNQEARAKGSEPFLTEKAMYFAGWYDVMVNAYDVTYFHLKQKFPDATDA